MTGPTIPNPRAKRGARIAVHRDTPIGDRAGAHEHGTILSIDDDDPLGAPLEVLLDDGTVRTFAYRQVWYPGPGPGERVTTTMHGDTVHAVVVTCCDDGYRVAFDDPALRTKLGPWSFVGDVARELRDCPRCARPLLAVRVESGEYRFGCALCDVHECPDCGGWVEQRADGGWRHLPGTPCFMYPETPAVDEALAARYEDTIRARIVTGAAFDDDDPPE